VIKTAWKGKTLIGENVARLAIHFNLQGAQVEALTGPWPRLRVTQLLTEGPRSRRMWTYRGLRAWKPRKR